MESDKLARIVTAMELDITHTANGYHIGTDPVDNLVYYVNPVTHVVAMGAGSIADVVIHCNSLPYPGSHYSTLGEVPKDTSKDEYDDEVENDTVSNKKDIEDDTN